MVLAGRCAAAAGADRTPALRCPVTESAGDLRFTALAPSWDEGIPLGNAVVGALVWQHDGALRLSLDRTDLWDLRPVDSLSGDNYRFAWVKEHIRRGDYLPVQQKFDHPYNRMPAPSKIPGAALEFPLAPLGEPASVRLYLDNALCEVLWAGGTRMQTFVHATRPVGWFCFTDLPAGVEPELVTPQYGAQGSHGEANSITGQDLPRLGYDEGRIERSRNRIVYRQPGYDGFFYEVAVTWARHGSHLVGTWSITSSLCGQRAATEAAAALRRGIRRDYEAHMAYWRRYWAQSSVTLPDSILQRQYANEMYKFGSAARADSYPISLQAVWTADNGKLPPWKGDYHHDLNTQLSYWPAYAGNRLDEGMGYLNTLWNQQESYKRYTRQYFEAEGMNIPGVCTLTGEPMGGWIQYAMSQTVSAWLAQHFYLHWKYSADRHFLETRGYPFVREAALFLEAISEVDGDGQRRLEFSSSPEIFDNSLQAWFTGMTNYDLALMRFLFGAAAEMAGELGLDGEASRWAQRREELPPFDLDADGSLTFAPGFPYNASHRHFSHAMAIHPLGLIDWHDGDQAQRIIRATLDKMEQYGPDYWTGYSYSWFANMQARALDGDKAARALRIFAECFCLPNTFHVNGDQSGTGKSRLTYRPFTLEGNFAFAAAIHEMLLQSHTGVIRLFPAIPDQWHDVAFSDLRAVGGHLVSAVRRNGAVERFTIRSERGGRATYIDPLTGAPCTVELQPGQTFVWTPSR